MYYSNILEKLNSLEGKVYEQATSNCSNKDHSQQYADAASCKVELKNVNVSCRHNNTRFRDEASNSAPLVTYIAAIQI